MPTEPLMHATRDGDGFRERGLQATRLETFVDAAFAFAVTLLVISFNDLPDSYPALVEALKRGPGFVASFAILVMFWMSHNRFSRRTGFEDGWIVVYSLALVALTLLYVYPLRMIMGVAMHFMTGGWAPIGMSVDSQGDVRGLYMIYAVGFFAMALLTGLMNLHALRRGDALSLDATERFLLRSEVVAMVLLSAPALASFVLAWRLPVDGDGSLATGLPGMVYCLLAVVMPLYGVVAGRRRARLAAATSQGDTR